jgi:hypothetical protein
MINEDEMQQKVESGEAGSDRDARAYKTLFRMLLQEKPMALPDSFAEKVIRRVRTKQRTKIFLEEYLLTTIAIAVIVGGGVYSIMITGFKFDLGFLSGLSSYSGVIGFGILLTILLNLLDRRLFQRRASDNQL